MEWLLVVSSNLTMRMCASFLSSPPSAQLPHLTLVQIRELLWIIIPVMLLLIAAIHNAMPVHACSCPLTEKFALFVFEVDFSVQN